jgi:hypothetical protein
MSAIVPAARMPLTKALIIEFLPMVALARSRAECPRGDAPGVNNHPTCTRCREIHDALKAPPDKRHDEDGSATKLACKANPTDGKMFFMD